MSKPDILAKIVRIQTYVLDAGDYKAFWLLHEAFNQVLHSARINVAA